MKLKVGDIISSNMPLVHVINQEQKHVICDYCLASSKNLKRCSGCKKMSYCDHQCQKTDWSKHKYECKLYANHYDVISNDTVRFLLRMLLFLTKNPQAKSEKYTLLYDKSIGRSYEDMMTHKENITNDAGKYRKFAMMCTNFQKLNISLDKGEFFEMFCKVCVNWFTLVSAYISPIGSAVYVAESMFDHSCSPNATPIFTGIHMEVRCIKPIAENEPITINYFDLIQPKYARQKILKEDYYFDCQCPRCELDLPRGFDYEQLKNSLDLMDQYTQSSKFDEALKIGVKTMKDIDLVLDNKPYPFVVVRMFHLFQLGMLLNPVLDSQSAAIAKRAANMVKTIYREDHDLYKFYKPLMS